MIGSTLGDFTLLEPMARGGIGEVWRARHTSGTPAAVKLLTHEGVNRAVWAESIHAEIRAVAGLDHPNIVWIHDAGVTHAGHEALPGGTPWFAMELARQGTLKDRQEQVSSFGELRRLLLALLDALAHAHARGIVHRDIKPANVLFDDHTPKLSDFGLVFSTDPSKTRLPIGGGTPAYMAPEQFDGQASDLGPWTDLYSVGVMAYALATGHRPFLGRSWVHLYDAHLNQTVPPLKPKFEVPKGFEPWLHGLLAKSRHQRFQHAADARHVLTQLDQHDTLPTIGEDYASSSTDVTKTEGRFELPNYPRPPFPETLVTPPARRQTRGTGLGLYGLRDVPMVGRQEERAALWQALSAVFHTEMPQAIVLRGAGGVGKSRLAEWVCQQAAEAGVAEVFHTTHGPLPGALDGIAGLLARALQVHDPDPETLTGILEAELGPRGIRDPWMLATLGELLQPGANGPRLQSMRQRYELVTRVLRARSGGRTAIVWFDDVQWGPEAIELCEHLLNTDLPCLLLLTVREEALVDEVDASAALDDLLTHDDAWELEVPPLQPAASIALIQQGLGLHPRLSAKLYRRVAGNPMFAVELVGAWVERGLLEPGPDGFTLADPQALHTPATVGAVWDGRLKALFRTDPDFELPLAAAAALGIGVDHGEWQRVCDALGVVAPPTMWGRLQELRLVRRDPGMARYAFVHGMLRETILERMGRVARLSEVHRAVAHALDDPGRRGLHLLEAGDLASASTLLLEAARSTSNTDLKAAIRLLQLRDEALEAHDADDPARVEGWLMASEFCRLGAKPDDGIRWARTALQWASARRHRVLMVRALQESAACARMTGDLVHARHHVDTAMRMSEGLAAKVRAATLFQCGAVLLDSGDLKGSERAVRRALELFEDPPNRIRAASMLGFVLAQMGHPKDAESLLNSYLELARQCPPLRLADLHNTMGEVARQQRHWTEAELHYRTAVDTLQGTGISDPGYRANLALVLLARGETSEARRMLFGVMDEAEAIGARMLALLAHAGLAACAADLRTWQELRRHLLALREDEGGLISDDIARCLQFAGTHAMAMEQPHLGRMALELAAVHLRALGRHEHADEALQKARAGA